MLSSVRSFIYAYRRLFTRLLSRGRISIARDVKIGRHVRLSATDGGQIVLEEGVFIGDHSVVIARSGVLTIGARTHCSHGATVTAKQRICIGEDCLFGEYVTIRDQDHAVGRDGPSSTQFTKSAVVIGNNVWIGAKATIVQGTVVGDRVVIGANAVARGDLVSDGRYVGVPAKRL